MPMGGAGLQNQGRQMGGNGNVSFAQSLSGSQPATPLDLSYVAIVFRPWRFFLRTQYPEPFIFVSAYRAG